PAFARLRDAALAWKAAAHITGGGLVENPPRFLSDDALAVELDPATWAVPGIFALIAGAGVDAMEMRRTFNLGLGMIVAVRARAAGVPAVAVDHTAHATREAFEAALLAALAPHAPDAVVLAGFMRVLTPHFLAAFPSRVVNTHPALLPAFPGAHAIDLALAA